jgi:ABC-type transport system involved in multi-copper enzyme maturation permease subunit
VLRELAIALRARVTWLVAAVAALLVGHGFMLAIDLYSASSRSALASLLQAREMDPLLGVVRPTLGGVSLALSLLGPVLAARTLAVEKERRTYGALCLAVGSSTRVVLQKALAGALACGTVLLVPLLLFGAFRAVGGHVDAIETGVALGGEVLHLVLMAAIAIAAAAWTRTFAQAVTLGILASLTSWAIDASEGFAALAWLGGASAWSIEHRLLPFQRGIVSVGSVLWLVLAAGTALGIALVGGSFERWKRKALVGAGVIGVGVLVLAAAGGVRRGFDWSEERRASLPPAAVGALRAMPQSIGIDVFLDRDDSRRRQLESDALAKLVLARPDLVVRTPLDDDPAVTEVRRGSEYGRILVRVGDSVRETRSTSRRELTTLIFEAAGRPLPDWTQGSYPGFPLVLEGARRRVLGILAYVALPLAFVVIGFALTHRRTTR